MMKRYRNCEAKGGDYIINLEEIHKYIIDNAEGEEYFALLAGLLHAGAETEKGMADSATCDNCKKGYLHVSSMLSSMEMIIDNWEMLLVKHPH